uniref:Major facilitator superfamily (MFS) profile domain-containing protein n=1 Tax=Ciona savignyi TaxID=51511 RepID=H2YE44_CIOSA
MDMSPSYSGIAYAMSNTLTCAQAMYLSQIIAAILKNGAISNWKIVFYLIAGISAASLSVFLIFGTSEEQNWDQSTETEDIKNKQNLIVKSEEIKKSRM